MSEFDRAEPLAGSFGEVLSEPDRGFDLTPDDASEKAQLRRQIEFLKYHDPLTGLPNRVWFDRQVLLHAASGKRPIAVAMGDVNGLKIANDVFGRTTGDQLLEEIAEVLESNLDDGDLLARYSGDEFILLRVGSDSVDDFIEKVDAQCAGLTIGALPVSISIGTAAWTRADLTLEDAIRSAEYDMHRRKMSGIAAFRATLIESIKTMLFDRSLETGRHVERTAACCRLIGEAMGLPEKDRVDLDLLAMLHDIGKIAIRESIVFKPTALEEAEWMEIKRHTELGFRIAQSTPELFHIAESILSHHEWWDGRGYPNGASGMNIPRLARILSIADAFDAMTNYRPFRDILSIEDAAAEIRKGAGTQFDPYIADIFLKRVLGPEEEPARTP